MIIGFEVLSDESQERCDRCKSKEWARLGFRFTPSLHDTAAIEFPKGIYAEYTHERSLRVILCIDCLAHAIQSVTGWNIRKLLKRYREVSPLYGTVPVGLDVIVLPKDQPAEHEISKRMKRKPVKKGK